jgi:hypothetical protein
VSPKTHFSPDKGGVGIRSLNISKTKKSFKNKLIPVVVSRMIILGCWHVLFGGALRGFYNKKLFSFKDPSCQQFL